ncbi:MAG: lipoprotein [Chromatiales bacterium]|nr:lipoprotein [Chromatiales bacterium]
MSNIPYFSVCRMAVLLAALICCLMLTACGQKGELYLPDAPNTPDSNTNTNGAGAP